MRRLVKRGWNCPSCGERLALVDIPGQRRYECTPCGVTQMWRQGRPSGSPADRQTSAARAAAHRALDAMWQKGNLRKHQARAWLSRRLSRELGIEEKRAHIRFLDVEQCIHAIRCCTSYTMNRGIIGGMSPIRRSQLIYSGDTPPF